MTTSRPEPADGGDEPAARRQRVEFGLFDWVDLAPGRAAGQTYDARLRLLAEADQGGGFAVYHLAEHHGTPLGLAPSPALLLAAAARVTSRIRLAPTTFVVPLYDPLRLTQEIAMLDQLCHGRLEIGVGRGSSWIEAAMFGLTADEAAARFERDLPAVIDALVTGEFRRPGEADAAPVQLHVPVAQRPHPPLWYPTSNPASIPRLGEQGYNVLFGFSFFSPPPHVIWEQSKVFFDHVRAAIAATGRTRYGVPPAAPPRFGVVRHVLVAPTDDEAIALARPAYADHCASFTHLWRQHGVERFSTLPSFDELLATGRLLIGSPRSVAAQISDLLTGGEVNYLAGVFAWGSLAPDASLRSLRLFRDAVIPTVQPT
ncbi:MAG: LLM class flavin-dependent oxidoreductase, partial [Frankia sp.]|nr:LLM class flavin-dependent oxidoreductase [Frankia sp.]